MIEAKLLTAKQGSDKHGKEKTGTYLECWIVLEISTQIHGPYQREIYICVCVYTYTMCILSTILYVFHQLYYIEYTCTFPNSVCWEGL